jgi:sugar phosphate isomerase/epimerase
MKNKSSRRDFLRISAAGALGALVMSHYANGQSSPTLKANNLALQLYTIRDAMAVDVPGSLKKVADIGFKYLELAGYSNRKFYGMEPTDFKKLVNDLGMKIISSHTNVEAEGITTDNAKIMVEDHAKLGVKYCIQPWVVPEARTVDSYKKMVQDWNTVGKIMKEQGIQFGYHNHNFEFDNLNGVVPFYDIIMTDLDKEIVIELDLFWATKAGQNPIDIFNKYPGRFHLFHMKDMYTKEAPYYTTDGEDDFAPVGEGLINFKEILAAKDIAGLKYMVVEQDATKDGKPFDAIKTSLTNLNTKILI